jgi:fused signal recognition particle receptor
MVYDWFNRSAAPQNPEEPQPEQTPQPPAAEEAPAAPAAPAVGAVDQDALDWARQAYARLKAQQEAQKQAAAGSPAVSASAPAPQVSAADAAVTTAQDSDQSVQNPGQSVEVAQSPAPEPPAPPVFKAVIAPETPAKAPLPPSAPQPPAAPAAGLSLLEQAAAQRAQRQQELLERAIDVPTEAAAPTAAPATAPVAAPADEAAPQLGAFDEDFTWSAEVLAAQGRNLDDISLEEIDWLGRLRRGMEKTRRGFVTQLLDNLGDDPLTPEVLDDLESLLLRADVGVQATDQVLEALRKRLNEEVVEPAEGIRFLKEQLKALLDAPIQASGAQLLAPGRGRLNVWLMVGVNGVGKTTTLGKLANLAVRSGYSCLIAAADTFRAAAVQQVAVWGERSGVTVVSNPSANADPAAVVFDAIGAAQAKGTDLVLVDTAGRLQTKHNLMEELSKVRRIVDKLAPDALVQSLLVLDASQGQNGLKQAMAFAQAAGLTGVVITKLDGSSRGGVALAVASEAGLPIRFIGAGEGIRDLRPFNSFEFVEALLAK